MSTLTPPRTIVKPARGTCRLTLAINGAPYRVGPVTCDPSAALRCYEPRKADGAAYHVSQHGHGAECTCPDFVYRRDGIDPAGCKHVKALAAFGLIVADVRPIRGGAPVADAHPLPSAAPGPVAAPAPDVYPDEAPEADEGAFHEPSDDGSPTPSYWGPPSPTPPWTRRGGPRSATATRAITTPWPSRSGGSSSSPSRATTADRSSATMRNPRTGVGARDGPTPSPHRPRSPRRCRPSPTRTTPT